MQRRQSLPLCLMLAVTPALADPQAEGFRKLDGAAIRQAFAGHLFTDETHFAFHYLPDGKVEGEGMGSKVSRNWRIAEDELCVTDAFGENCYAVWSKDAEVKLIMDESDLSLDGLLK